jgi:uncharacterized protein (DUF2147 family)
MRHLLKSSSLCFAFATAFGALAIPASAQEKAVAPAASAEDNPKVKVERGKGGKKVYRIEEEIRIEGKIQKSEAFYVLQKSGINYDWQELKQDFLPKILESVTRAPF